MPIRRARGRRGAVVVGELALAVGGIAVDDLAGRDGGAGDALGAWRPEPLATTLAAVTISQVGRRAQ
jgi:hypothetical protein